MSRWISIAACEDCPPGASLEAVAEDRIIAVFNVGGEYYALDGVCPHQGGPLGEGTLQGCVVTCPWHGWQFDVRDGQQTFAPTVKQPVFPTRVRDGQIEIALDSVE
ncbi:MAG: Rieske 2Fe-2S domain-containing protein [Pirellulales bacterium]|nr:Rieske 2Fe-2S domain-containing protein [Pirellulales bacterium]